jgi:hypothetical protein
VSVDFEPPRYIQSLIGAINDAAKAAQTSALFLLALGLYLVATVISTTDEDLLRGTAVQVSQLGVRTPVAIAYALAPTIFLFLHVHTLIRFDMLAANLRLLTAELARAVPLAADRERCRALLANVEFVQFLAAPPGSPFRSPLFRFMAWLIVSALPVAVFLAVQISFLRYQSVAITTLHQVCLALDLAALSWFHTRVWLAGQGRKISIAALHARMAAINFILPMVVLAFAVVYAGVPSAERTTVGARRSVTEKQRNIADSYRDSGLLAASGSALRNAAVQPLDLGACPWLGVGCRFLRLDHRTLLANSPPGDVLVRLRTGKSDDLEKDLAHVEWPVPAPAHASLRRLHPEPALRRRPDGGGPPGCFPQRRAVARCWLLGGAASGRGLLESRSPGRGSQSGAAAGRQPSAGRAAECQLGSCVPLEGHPLGGAAAGRVS